jgi:hypothetical protein
MTEVPKIVQKRLRVAGETLQGHPHPEADVLSAFAEQALTAGERDGVLEHLSLCEDCREAVTLALPAEAVVALRPVEAEADRATLIPAKANRGWLGLGNFAWPTLRWAALAAGVAVAAAVLLLHPGKLNQEARTSVPTSVQTRATRVAPQISDSPGNGSSMETVSTAAKLDSNASYTSPKSRLEAGVVGRNIAATNSPKASPNSLIANNLAIEKLANDNLANDKLANDKKQSSDMSPGAARANRPSIAIESMDANVGVSAASPNVLTSSPDNTLMARNDAPAIEKAKPVPQQIETESAGLQTSNGAPAAAKAMIRMRQAAAMPLSRDAIRNASWAITAGVLQRSLDSGQTWQNALHADHPLLCYANLANLNEELWAGGEKGELFRSTDSGLTWMRVQPSVSGQQLSGDVTHIEVRVVGAQPNSSAAKEIVVTTSNNEAWSSLDSGITWNKK